MSDKNFKFWMPIDKIEKANNDKGEVVMKLGGIASTGRRDTDGESLDPQNFDISYLNSTGIINYNHSKLPSHVIGEPSIAEIRPEGLYVETLLYQDSELAKSVYALAQTLQKNSKTRKLGYSIEGKATERDPSDPSRVTKAMITNVAITLNPKNQDSIIDIIKGNFSEYIEDTNREIKDPLKEVNVLIKAFTPLEERDQLKENLEKALEEGDTYTIIKAEEAVEKALMAGDTTGRDTTNVSNPGSGAALKMESINHDVKHTKDAFGKDVKLDINDDNDDDNLDNDKEEKEKIKKSEDTENQEEIDILTKSDVYEKIFLEFPGIGFEKAENIFNAINNLAMSSKQNNTPITDDLLEKAFSVLKDINYVDETEEDVTKGEDSVDDKVEDDLVKSEEEDENVDDLNKGIEEDTDIVNDNELIKSLDSINENTGNGFNKIGIILKGIYDMQKSQSVSIKEINDKIADSDKTIQKSITDSLSTENVVIKELIEKGQKTISDMIADFGNQAPGPKSIQKRTVQERNFVQGTEMQKGLAYEPTQRDPNTLSITGNKSKIIAIMDKMTFEKGLDNEMANDMTLYESGSILQQRAKAKMEARGIKFVD